jgi:tetratricopeptide (TPR) repeat protein
MAEGQLETRIGIWVERCRVFVDSTSEVPYIGEIMPEVEEFLPLSFEEKDQELHLAFGNLLERHVQANPAELSHRFAVLYPFRDAGMLNPYDPSPFPRPTEPVAEAFEHFAGLVMPEKLSDLRAVKFELHISYLTRNWSVAEEIFRRAALLELMPTWQLHLLRGHFYFASVFGRRIEFEWSNQISQGEFEFYWPSSLPTPSYDVAELSFPPTWLTWAKAARRYCRPEPIESGSPAHWLLTAWCTNPRAPKPMAFPPEAIEFLDPDQPRKEVADPEPYRPTLDSMREYIHDQNRNFQLFAPPPLSAEEQERLGRAIEDLRSGILLSPIDSSPYRVLLARALYAIKECKPAAVAYSELLASPYQFTAHIGDHEDEANFEWEISFSAALSHYFAGDLDGAIAALDSLRSRIPNAPGAAWWMAKWHSEAGRYDEAAAYLKSESEAVFSPPESWQLSTILTLGQIAKEQERASLFIGELAKRAPSQLLIMTAVVQEYWPTFNSITEDSRNHWLMAVHLVHADHPPELRPALLNSAIREYGWVVEQELKDSVFSPFRQKTHSDTEALRQARADFQGYGGDFYKYLFAAKPKVGLGAMIAALKSITASVVPTDKRFASFVRNVCPGIIDVIADLELILSHRDIATHESKQFDIHAVTAVASACRRVLDEVHNRAASAGAG